MAFDWSKLNFFSRLDARARVVVLLLGVVGTVFLIYLIVRIFFGGGETTGGSVVATTPQSLTSVPGGVTTPEVTRTIAQRNVAAAKQAQQTGTSAFPLLQYQQPATAGAPNCIICSDQLATVNNDLDDWVRKGQVNPDVAANLEQLAASNVPVDQFAAELDRLVKEGKLTPEQARRLLEQYKKQHANALLQDSAKTMDAMIKSGELPLNVASELLNDQRNNMSPADYAAELQRLVREGKISPATAARLLAQYTQQCIAQSIKENNIFIQQMARSGEITAQVAGELSTLSNNNASVTDYSNALKNDVSQGKLTPAAATKLIATYNKFKSACVGAALINQMIQQAEAAAYKEINDLLAAGKITKDVAIQLASMIKNNASLADYQTTIAQLVQQGKLTPEIGKLKLADYQKIKQLREEAERLASLQANNATPDAYADELKRAVQAGILTPDEAARLLQEYQAATMRAPVAPQALGTTPEAQALAKLQASVQQGQVPPTPPTGQFAAAQAQAALESEQDRQARIQAIMAAMSGQATQLINSWQPPQMQYKEGSQTITTKGTTTTVTGAPGTTTTETTTTSTTAPALIKGGTVLFAVLDTAINSDYPDTPVMATIVEGKFKGARLLGKIVTTKGVTGQLDRVTMNFTTMNMDEWPKSLSITAYAIDPDTARTVMASSVNYHYMQRFGAMFATSFLQGYANAIMTSGSTQTTGIFGTSSVHPNLSPSQKIAVGLGQFGQTLGQATANYINRPPTVKVDSGVGLGILFMSDVSMSM